MNGCTSQYLKQSLTQKISSISIAFLSLIFTVSSYASIHQTENISPKVLTFSDHQPLERMRTQFLKDVLFPAIEKESNGRLRIETHWDGEIAKAYDALGAVSQGQVDMATTVPEYTAKELPLHQIFKSFPVGPSSNQQIDFFQKVYHDVPDFTAELEKNNLVPIFFGTGYPVAFYSASPLEKLDDIAGKKWRSASFWHLDFLKNAGATPVTMHWGPEIYDAMKAKELDGLMVNVDSGYFLDVHHVAPNIIASKALWLGHVYPLTMNKDTWNSLTSEDQKAIQRAVAQSYLSLGSVMDSSYATMIKQLKSSGANVRELSADEVTQWEKATDYENVQMAWIAEQEKNGNTNARSVLAQVQSLMKETMIE